MAPTADIAALDTLSRRTILIRFVAGLIASDVMNLWIFHATTSRARSGVFTLTAIWRRSTAISHEDKKPRKGY